jgi:Phage integrase, N-terminal SAM-like domain
MQPVPSEVWASFERRLNEAGVPAPRRADYRKWVCFYLDFCHKYGHPPRSLTSLGPFLGKLAAKNQSGEQREQAAHAIRLLLGGSAEPSARLERQSVPGAGSTPAAPGGPGPAAAPRAVAPQPRPMPLAQTGPLAPPAKPTLGGGPGSALRAAPVRGRGASWEEEYRDLEGAIKLRNYSRKTLAAYRFWVGKFQAFVRSRPTEQLGTQEVRGFLTELAVRHGVAASTQNQAFGVVEG